MIFKIFGDSHLNIADFQNKNQKAKSIHNNLFISISFLVSHLLHPNFCALQLFYREIEEVQPSWNVRYGERGGSMTRSCTFASE